MIILLTLSAIILLMSKLKSVSIISRHNYSIYILVAAVLIVLFNLYVEIGVGWKYGVPFDDDSRWIFKSAIAMSEGAKWSDLYLLVSRDWDLTNRMLSLSNLGQYIYATFVSWCLYYPTIFDLHINIYLLYFLQLLLVSISIMDLSVQLDYIGVKYYKKKPHKTVVFFMLIFYPVILFNTGKMMREAFFVFFMVEMFAKFLENSRINERKNVFLIYAFLTLIVRPNSIIIIAPLVIWNFFNDTKIVIIANMSIMAVLLFGTSIVNSLTNIVGWGYSIGVVDFSEVVHLIMFPNFFNQIKEFANLSLNPSWQVVLYFFQSIWNIPIIILMVIGVIVAKNKKHAIIFLTLFINANLLYSIAYNVEFFTPRYKLIYLLPQFYFVYIAMCFIKSRIKFR